MITFCITSHIVFNQNFIFLAGSYVMGAAGHASLMIEIIEIVQYDKGLLTRLRDAHKERQTQGLTEEDRKYIMMYYYRQCS